MKRIVIVIVILIMVAMQSCTQNNVEQKHKVRLSRIVVDSTRLDEYKTYLKEGIETSMRVEAGVLILYATAEIERPNHITIL